MHPDVHSSTIYNSQDVEAALNVHRQKTDDEDAVYTMEYLLLSHSEEWKMATRMDVEIIILSEVSQKEKDRCYVISLIYEIFKCKNELT